MRSPKKRALTQQEKRAPAKPAQATPGLFSARHTPGGGRVELRQLVEEGRASFAGKSFADRLTGHTELGETTDGAGHRRRRVWGIRKDRGVRHGPPCARRATFSLARSSLADA